MDGMCQLMLIILPFVELLMVRQTMLMHYSMMLHIREEKSLLGMQPE